MRNVVYPAILATTWDEYRYKIESAATFAEGVQIDVMDGIFVSNKTFDDFQKINVCKPGSLFFEIHLMVDNPREHIRVWGKVADSYILHMESSDNLMPLIEMIRTMKKEIGIAINPGTSIVSIFPYIKHINTVLIMTVEPGQGGQTYMLAMNDKIKHLRKKFSRIPIEVDGGINKTTIVKTKKAGANIFVAGTSIWNSDDPQKAFIELQSSIE